jgi:hypothetical protein
MKTQQKFLMSALGLLLALQLHAQNYKAPKIDASGKVTDEKGTVIGSVTTAGVVTDAAGTKVAYVNSEGAMVDAKTGKVLGKPEKNGIILPHFDKTKDKGWSVSTPMNGTCTVTDADGKVKAEVHENYKNFGACAVHCLQHKMDHH